MTNSKNLELYNELLMKEKYFQTMPRKSPVRRAFYLTRAMNSAKNPEFKELWKRKKEELLRIYNK